MPTAALFQAAKNIDQAGILAALAAGANVNATNFAKQTPLIVLVTAGPMKKSVFKKKLACVEELAKAGANLNATASSFGTALSWATMTGDCALVDYLIAHGASIDHAGDAGMTASSWAARILGGLEGNKSDKLNVLRCLRSLLIAGSNPFQKHFSQAGLLFDLMTTWTYTMGQPLRVKCAALLLASQGAEIVAGAIHCPPSSKDGRSMALDFIAALKAPTTPKLGWSSCPAVDLVQAKVDDIENFLLAYI